MRGGVDALLVGLQQEVQQLPAVYLLHLYDLVCSCDGTISIR